MAIGINMDDSDMYGSPVQDELEKYQKVNECESIEELQNAILSITNKNLIQGKTKILNGQRMASYVKGVVENDLSPNLLTRNYGIRQQALYLKHCYVPDAEKAFKVIETPVLNNLNNPKNPQ